VSKTAWTLDTKAMPLAKLGFIVTLLLALAPASSQAQARGPRNHDLRHTARTASGCGNANVAAGSASVAAMRASVVCLINRQRSSRRLPVLHASALLDHSAQGWTNAMVRTSLFSHGSDFSARISAAGFPWSAAGENIATGYATPRQVVAGWMASTGHCENILSPSFSDVGTGVSTRRLGRFSPSTWTQDFGLRMGRRAPSHNGGPARGCPYRI
jgi:uncharacterized protein YkwD